MGNQTPHDDSEVHTVMQISTRIRGRFPDAPTERIDREVRTVFHQFDGQPIRDFIPILVERVVIDRLSTRGSRSDVS